MNQAEIRLISLARLPGDSVLIIGTSGKVTDFGHF
jgi:hypothetical protein